MKEIKAIIQPFMVSKVIEALETIPKMPGVTISDVKGYGHRHLAEEPNVVSDLGVTSVPKVKLEIVVSDAMVEQVIEIVQKHAHTGNCGDGKIFVYDVQKVVRIRTGESGEEAI